MREGWQLRTARTIPCVIRYVDKLCSAPSTPGNGRYSSKRVRNLTEPGGQQTYAPASKKPEIQKDPVSTKHAISRGDIPACRAVQRIITDTLLPWREPDADSWLGFMNVTVYFPVSRPPKERAMVQRPAIRRCPIVNADDARQIIFSDLPPVAPLSIRKRYRDILEDIVTVCLYPRENIFNNPLLVPSPLLATATALQAVLIWCHGYFSGRS